MGKTSIEWCDTVWNPIVGCSRVSAGCQHCYAETMAYRLERMGRPEYHGLVEGFYSGGRVRRQWTGKVRCLPERLDQPLRWRKPQRIFVDSMGDLFHEAVPDDFVDRVFAVMALCVQHTFIVLTKRSERMQTYCSWEYTAFRIIEALTQTACGRARVNASWREDNLHGFQLSNVWLGVSVEDQKTADERIPDLLATPAAMRIISAEPLLARIDLTKLYGPCGYYCGEDVGHVDHGREPADWVIVGGETGPDARPCDVEWIRSIVHQCRDAHVPCFVKQLGARPRNWCMAKLVDGALATEAADFCDVWESGEGGHCGDRCWLLKDSKCADPSEWPADLRMRQLPGD